jgi:hypothetical protein
LIFPIHIELRRSRFLTFLLCFSHTLAATSVLVLPWPWALRSALITLLGVSLWRVLRRSEICALRLSERGEVDCWLLNGARVAASVGGDSTVFSRLIVLRLRLDENERMQNLVLLSDSLSAEQFRLLCLFLRWRVAALNAPAEQSV